MDTEYYLIAPWEDPASVPEEYLRERMRARRDLLLQKSDWTQLPDSPVDVNAWAVYRQALRDAPATWTPAPEWIPPAPPSA